MNTYAKVIPILTLRKVTYYTIRLEDEESSMFLNFINNHIEAFEDCINVIRTWLKLIGNRYGAQERFFRSEGFRRGDARALPPPSKYNRLIPEYIDTDCNLRLYCMRVNTNVVILFNGAEKTAATAQECKKVRPHFLLANKLTIAIDEAIIHDNQ